MRTDHNSFIQSLISGVLHFSEPTRAYIGNVRVSSERLWRALEKEFGAVHHIDMVISKVSQGGSARTRSLQAVRPNANLNFELAHTPLKPPGWSSPPFPSLPSSTA
jgi:hypothetical protein